MDLFFPNLIVAYKLGVKKVLRKKDDFSSIVFKCKLMVKSVLK